MIGAIQFFLLDLILSFLFYDSVIPAIFFLPGLWIYQRERRKKQTERQKEKAEGSIFRRNARSQRRIGSGIFDRKCGGRRGKRIGKNVRGTGKDGTGI